MKKILTSFFLLIVFLYSVNLYSQSVGDYQSFQSGNWSDVNSWSRWDGTQWVNPAPSTPDSTQNVAVTILSGHNITVAASVGIGSLSVNSGGTLTLTCSSTSTIKIATTAVITINGTFTIGGTVNAAAPYNVVYASDGSNTGSIIVANGGIVNINATNSTSGVKGFIPTATWQTGSTLNINSLGGSSATGWGTGNSQNFYNINYGPAVGTGNFGWGFTNNTISGDFNVTATGTTGRLQLFGGSSGTLNILGQLKISGASNFTLNGTSSATNDTVNVIGDVSVNTTGNFSISRGSQGGVGTSIFNLSGNVSITAGTMQNSNTTPDGAKFRFVKNGTQNLTIVPTTVSGNALPLEVSTNSNVNLLSSVNVTTLYLNGGIITSSSTNPLILGWWTGSALTSGTVSPTASGSSTSYVNGPMSFLYATALGNFSKTFPVGKGSFYRSLTLSLNQTTATLSTYTAEMFNSAPTANTLPGTLDGVSAVRYYVVSEGSGGSAFTAGTLQLSYDTDDGVSDATNLRIAQGPSAGGSTWVDLGGSGSANTTGTITSSNTFTDLTTNTVFTLADNAGGTNALPVELSSFSSSVSSMGVNLQWQTATELNNYGFEVERAEVNNNSTPQFSKIGFVKGSGNSSSIKSYSYTDNNALYGNFQYRLKQIDNNGSFKYSQVIEVNNSDKPLSFRVQNYPNPFNPTTVINYSLPEASVVTLSIYNVLGEKVATLVNQKQEKGIYNVNFNGTNLASGMYIYELSTGKNVISKKMMLLK